MKVLSRMSRENSPGEGEELSKTVGVRTVAVWVRRETELHSTQTKSGSALRLRGSEGCGGRLVRGAGPAVFGN